VKYGHLQEGVRESLAATGRITPRWQRAAFGVLRHHRVVLIGSSLLAIAQRAHLVPRRVGLGRLPLRRGDAVASTGNDVWLFTGCVMDAWMRDTHRNTAKVLAAIGVRLRVPGAGGACCGALHAHAGLMRQSRALAVRVMAAMPGTAPIVVNSAGCGAALKDYGHLLGTPEAVAFSARVVDIHEFLEENIDRLPATRWMGSVIVQDPCHLRHVQRTHAAVRTVLSRVADIRELDDEGLCCGAGGAYSAMEPQLAGEIRTRKLAAISRAGGGVVASANPGCLMHLGNAGLTVRHPVDLLAEAL
jgi:glycolate oxidase iron-sulfur subunit